MNAIKGDVLLTRELIDVLTPEHDRTSCDDTDLANAYVVSNSYVRCVRCHLLDNVGMYVRDLGIQLVVSQEAKPDTPTP